MEAIFKKKITTQLGYRERRSKLAGRKDKLAGREVKQQHTNLHAVADWQGSTSDL